MLRTQPVQTPFTKPWFAACRSGRLLIQHCRACGHYQFYPRTFCTNCSTTEQPAWVEAQGAGTVASFTIVHRAVSEAYNAPFIVALVDLEEGPRMMTHLVNCDPEVVHIGMPVRVAFESWSGDVDMPVFAPQAA